MIRVVLIIFAFFFTVHSQAEVFRYHCVENGVSLSVLASVNAAKKVTGLAIVENDGKVYSTSLTSQAIKVSPGGWLINFYFNPYKVAVSLADLKSLSKEPGMFIIGELDTRKNAIPFSIESSVDLEGKVRFYGKNKNCELQKSNH